LDEAASRGADLAVLPELVDYMGPGAGPPSPSRWTGVRAQAPDTEGVTVVDLDLDRLATIRAELPSLANRRLV
jgi:predicted amidohydrolase